MHNKQVILIGLVIRFQVRAAIVLFFVSFFQVRVKPILASLNLSLSSLF